MLVGGVQRAMAVSVPPAAPWLGVPMTGGPGAVVATGVTVLEEAE